MSNQKLTFGVFMPQGWKMELVNIPTASEKWNAAVRIAQRAEELGFDSIWVYDHFITCHGQRTRPFLNAGQ